MPSPPSPPPHVGRACAAAGLAALGGAGLGAHELRGSDLQIELLGVVWLVVPLVAAPLLAWLWRVPAPSLWSGGLALLGCVLAGLESSPAWGSAVIAGALIGWVAQPAPAPPTRGARPLALCLLLAGLAAAVVALARDLVPLLACLPLVIAAGRTAWGPATLQRALLCGLVGWSLLAPAGVAWARGVWTPGWFLAAFAVAALPLRLGRARDPFARHPVPWACAEYAAWVCLPLALWTLHVGKPAPLPVEPSMTGYLHQRLAYYAEHRDEFDLVFVGDSRTYCGIPPAVMDPLLEARSINLAVPAHWLPTQYPFLRDLLADLRPGTTVVLSLGPLNFVPASDTVQTGYPLSWGDAWDYLSFGFGFDALRPNLVEHSRLARALAPLSTTARELRVASDAFASRPLLAPSPPATHDDAPASDPYAEVAERLVAELSVDPSVAQVTIHRNQGRAVAVMVFGVHGGQQFLELDRAYFRGVQDASPTRSEFTPDLPRLRLFEHLLDMCQEAGVNLVVNALWEAPHTYAGERLELERSFMRETIRPQVEARGFAYVEVDFSGITDAHYLDYNHLNQDGVALYAPRLAEALRPHLRRD